MYGVKAKLLSSHFLVMLIHDPKNWLKIELISKNLLLHLLFLEEKDALVVIKSIISAQSSIYSYSVSTRLRLKLDHFVISDLCEYF